MCHLILLLPVAGLAVFFVLPALPAFFVYLIVLGVSVVVYGAIFDAMRRPVATGAETLVGQRAQVRLSDQGRLLVYLRGEMWRARVTGTSRQPKPGERVEVLALRGNCFLVKTEDEERAG